MRTKDTLPFLTLLLALTQVAVGMHAGAPEPRRDYPSRWMTYTTNDADLAFMLAPRWDLRPAFCDREILRDRIARRVCALDFSWSGSGEPCEVAVGPATRLEDVLPKLIRRRWRGGQPQIRIVSRDAIKQSPLAGGSACKRVGLKLLRERIAPGDLIIIGWVE